MNRHLAQALGATALGTLLLQPVTAVADPSRHARNENSAQHRGYASREDDRRNDRWDDRDDDRGGHYHRHRDFHDDYPRRGYAVHHHGHRYYYSRGAWYRPYGPRYVVVDPPVGIVVPFLPQYSATMYFGGIPHYRAGSVYYVWNPRARGYVVMDRPYRW